MGEINNGGGKILSRAQPQFPLDFDHADPVWSYKLGEDVMHLALKDDRFDMLVRDMRWNTLETPRLPWSVLAWKSSLPGRTVSECGFFKRYFAPKGAILFVAAILLPLDCSW